MTPPPADSCSTLRAARRPAPLPFRLAGPMVLAIGMTVLSAHAQTGGERPTPATPERAAADAPAQPADPAIDVDEIVRPANGAVRRNGDNDELVPLGFNDVPIKEIFGFIAEETGKVVIPVNPVSLNTKKITLLNDTPVPRSQALDLVLQAFRLNDVGVIERKDVVIVGDITQLMTTFPPIITSAENILERSDLASLVACFFQLEEVKASTVVESLQEKELPTWVQMSADDNSNQIIVYADVELCQQIFRMIEEIDKSFKKPSTLTFRLQHADAGLIRDSIVELFEDSGTVSSSGQRGRPATPRGRGGDRGQATAGLVDPIGAEIELRTTINTQQNTVTVTGDPEIVAIIAKLIEEEWDLPRPPGTSKIYSLQYLDPLRVADVLNSLLGQSTGGGGRGSAAIRGGSGGAADVGEQLAGIYRIEAFAETNQIFVFSRTEEALRFLDDFINEIDQPSEIGLPFVVELKHANAFELSEQLNALLAEDGAGASITAQETGLDGRSLGDDPTGGTGDAGNAAQIQFPWQRSGGNADEQAPESQLIGKVRIVPIARQNALAVLSPRPQRESVKELIGYFDRPGRQVMLSVIIAEMELDNDLSLGLRLSSDQDILSTPLPDNAFGGTAGIQGDRAGSGGSLFDSTILNASLNLNILLQALEQDSNLRILQQPVVFTSDNQEAFFFDGQQIPFITQTTINSNGNPTDSFEYQDVGVILNARPRITANRDVDIELRLELSAVVPGQTLFGGAIIDKRETTTSVVVKNGQTIVLSGILRESESRITRKVPLLGDIPLLGELFKTRTNEYVTSELVAFITPRVVDDPLQNDDNFQEEWRERLQRLSRPIKHQIEYYEENPDALMERFRGTRSSDETLPPGTSEIEVDPFSGREGFDPDDSPRGSADDSVQGSSASPRRASSTISIAVPDPLTADQIAAMDRAALLTAMTDVASARKRVYDALRAGDRSVVDLARLEEQSLRLDDEWQLLVDRNRAMRSPGGS